MIDHVYEPAIELYRKALALRQALSAADPANMSWLRDVALTQGRLGAAYQAAGRTGEARDAYRACLDLSERYAATNPANTTWQIDVVLYLYSLAFVDDAPRPLLERALAIVRRLEAEGRLNGVQATWKSYLEEALAAAPK